MFGWGKKDPVQQLQDAYNKKLEEARDTQRKGDIVGYSALMAEAEEIGKQMDQLQSQSVK